MVVFEVNDMTCGHCAGAITKAVNLVDPGAKVTVNVAAHQVLIEPTASTVAVLQDAIKTAGFTPVAVTGGPAAVVKAAPRTGCCCG